MPAIYHSTGNNFFIVVVVFVNVVVVVFVNVVVVVIVVVVYHIWPHVNLDKRAEHRRELMKNEMWRETRKFSRKGDWRTQSEEYVCTCE